MNSLKPLLFGLVLGLTLALGFTVYATWSPPTELPPNCTAGNPGCDAPLTGNGTEEHLPYYISAGTLADSPLARGFDTSDTLVGLITDPGMGLVVDGRLEVDGGMAVSGDLSVDGDFVAGTASIAGSFVIDSTGTLTAGNIPWARLSGLPSSCPSGEYVSGIGGTLTCSAPAGTEGGGETLIELANFDASTADNYAWVVPAEAVLLHIDVRGPEGATGAEKCYEWEGNDGSRPCTAAYGGGPGGKGARVQARFSGLEGRTLYINVGSVYSNRGVDIRNGGSALANRIIVAGGGGAGSSAGMETGGFRGGDGGLNGQDGELPEWGGTSGGGATPSVAGVGGTGTGSGTDGTLGYGGSGFDGIDVDGGLGGGGMYGGASCSSSTFS